MSQMRWTRLSDWIKGALVMLIVIAIAAATFRGIQAIRRGDAPGQQAAAYLDALVKLGKLPTGAQVEQAMRAAKAGAQAPVIPAEKKPASKPETEAPRKK